MSWFWFSLIALLCWSGSDLFSKIGCRDPQDHYSHLKMVTAVGIVMGLHAAFEIFVGGTTITWQVLLTYLPVSALYILSMTVGYIGLRYIELSISSPICHPNPVHPGAGQPERLAAGRRGTGMRRCDRAGDRRDDGG